MKLILILTLLSRMASADVTLESRNGMTTPHSEGRPIVRYLSENSLAYSVADWEFLAMGNIYGTQNWAKRVNKEDGLYKTDAVRFNYGAEIRYWIIPELSTYVRHTMPIDRHDSSVGDGWSDTSYRMDVGIVYNHTLHRGR